MKSFAGGEKTVYVNPVEVNEEGREDCWTGEEREQGGATGETAGYRGWRKRPIHYAGMVSLLERRHDLRRGGERQVSDERTLTSPANVLSLSEAQRITNMP